MSDIESIQFAREVLMSLRDMQTSIIEGVKTRFPVDKLNEYQKLCIEATLKDRNEVVGDIDEFLKLLNYCESIIVFREKLKK